MRFPDFLIIGAMKAGTTSLYRDLLQNPAIFMPSDKEPGNLGHDEVLAGEGKSQYAKLFEKAKPGQICGEASTAYSKLPDIPGVPERAVQLCGTNLKVIYLIREPIERIVSQHHHELITKKVNCSIDQAVRNYPRFIQYSKYAMQITPWTDTLGMRQVLVIGFETYITDRCETLERICRFLGIDARSEVINTKAIYNRSEGMPMLVGPVAALWRSRLYHQLVRPFLSLTVRNILRERLLPRAKVTANQPSTETLRFLVKEIGPDVNRLKKIMKTDCPNWAATDLGRCNLSPSAQGLQGRRGGASGTPKCFSENPDEMEQ